MITYKVNCLFIAWWYRQMDGIGAFWAHGDYDTVSKWIDYRWTLVSEGLFIPKADFYIASNSK